MNEIDTLKKRIQELEEALEAERTEKERIADEKERIADEKERIEKEFSKTKKEFEDTKKDFEEFKAKHSHTVSELHKALKIKADKQKQGKPLGLPKEHKGYWRHVPERWDAVKALKLNRCPHCNTRLLSEVQEWRSRTVTDISLRLKAKNTRYDIPRKYCSKACQEFVRSGAAA